jgi:hypothetical protein
VFESGLDNFWCRADFRSLSVWDLVGVPFDLDLGVVGGLPSFSDIGLSSSSSLRFGLDSVKGLVGVTMVGDGGLGVRLSTSLLTGVRCEGDDFRADRRLSVAAEGALGILRLLIDGFTAAW